jgi:hypothetical protein
MLWTQHTTIFFTSTSPTFAITNVQSFCILEVPCSNQYPESGYPDVFCIFLTFSSYIPKLGYDCIHPQLFQFLIHYHYNAMSCFQATTPITNIYISAASSALDEMNTVKVRKKKLHLPSGVRLEITNIRNRLRLSEQPVSLRYRQHR